MSKSASPVRPRPLRLDLAALLVPVLLLLPAVASAQSLGVHAGLARSDYRELASPSTLGLHGTIPILGWLRARGDYRRYHDEERWTRSTCRGLVDPGADCPDDVFRGDFTLHAVGVGLILAAPLHPRLTVVAGVQRSVTWVDGVWRGRASGVRTGRAPDRREAGWSVLASAGWAVAPHLELTVGGRLESPQIRSCVADGYSGFCDTHDLSGLEVGVTLRR